MTALRTIFATAAIGLAAGLGTYSVTDYDHMKKYYPSLSKDDAQDIRMTHSVFAGIAT